MGTCAEGVNAMFSSTCKGKRDNWCKTISNTFIRLQIPTGAVFLPGGSISCLCENTPIRRSLKPLQTRLLSASGLLLLRGAHYRFMAPTRAPAHHALARTQKPQRRGRCRGPAPAHYCSSTCPRRPRFTTSQTTYLTVIYSPTSLEPLLFMYLFGRYFSSCFALK